MHAQGKFTITVRDKDTLEEKRIIEEDNVVTFRGEWKMHRERSMLASEHNYYDDIVISNEKIVPGIDILQHITHKYGSGSNLKSPEWFVETETTPGFVELYQRFQPATSQRVINTIYIGNGASSEMFAYAGLQQPCIQETTEVLDVYYRVQFFPGDIESDDADYTSASGYADTLYRQNAYGGGQWSGTAYYATPHWAKAPKNNDAYYTLARLNREPYNAPLMSINSRNWDDTNWMVTNTWDRSINDEKGKMMGMLAYGYPSGSSNSYRSAIHTPMMPDDFAYKPIQPIHRHSVDAPTPFLDVDYLATSTGILDVNGDNWEFKDDGYPEFHRINFTKTGAVEDAKYTFAERKCLGFQSTYRYGWRDVFDPGTGNYRPDITVFPYLSHRYDTITGGHGLRNVYDFVEYDKHSFIMWDETGITVMNSTNGDYEILDATSTVQLPVTNVYQVASESQIIYVACADTGLYKIENAMNDAVTTVVTKLNTSLTSGCYGVDIGNNEHVFAMFNDGLYHSTDFGANWTAYNPTSTPAFDFTGITDGLWDRVRQIKIDREDANHQMMVVYVNDNDISNNKAFTMWWNTTGTATAGYTWNNLLHTLEGRARTSRVKCSRYGSFWIVNDDLTYKVYPNTADYTRIGDNDNYARANNATFFYDEYGTPYTYAMHTWDGSHPQFGLYREDLQFVGNIDAWGNIDSNTGWRSYSDGEKCGMLFSWEFNRSDTNGLGLAYKAGDRNDGYMSDAYRLIPLQPYNWKWSSNNRYYGCNVDSWNGIGTPWEDFTWNKYGWNGSAWEKGFLIDAADLSGKGNNGTRKNFHPGEGTFYGNAVLESPDYTTPLTSATIAMTTSYDLLRPYVCGTNANTMWMSGAAGNNIKQRIYKWGETYFTDEGYLTGDWKGHWHNDIQVLETHFQSVGGSPDLGHTHTFYHQMQPNEEHRIVNTFNVEANGSTMLNGDHVRFDGYYTTTHGDHYYDKATNNIHMEMTSHSSGEYYGVNAYVEGARPLQTNDFRVSFNRTCSLSWREEAVDRILSPRNGRFMVWLVDGNVSFTRDVYWGHMPRPAKGAGSYVAVGLPGSLLQKQNNLAPRIFTEVNSYDDNYSSVDYTVMTEVVPWDDADFDGTAKIDIDFVHDGTTYTVNIYSDGVLKYTGVANADGRSIPRPTDDPKVIINWTAGENATASEDLANFKITDLSNNDLVVSGNSLVCRTYIDGQKVDQWTMPDNSYTFDAVSFGAESNRFGDRPYYQNFFKGKMHNIQVWDTALSDVSVTDDFAVMPTVTTTQSSANLVTHYSNTDVDYEAETKTVHLTEEPLVHGLTNSFQAGSAEPSFVKSDYFTYGVIDGILKDNAISYSGKFDWYTKRIKTLSDIEDPATPASTSPVIPAADSSNVTDHITWIVTEGANARPGRISGTYYYHWGSWGYIHAWSFDYIPIGVSGSMEFRVGSERILTMVGFDEQPDLLASTAEGNGYSFLNYSFHHMTNGHFRIYESGTHRTEFADTPYQVGDLFKIERVGTEIRYFHNGSLVYTSLVESTNNLWAGYNANMYNANYSTTIYDCKMSAPRKANVLYLGDTQFQTGRWDPDHLLMDKLEGGYSVQVNGVEQLVTLTWNTRMSTMPEPLPGEVVISRNAGIIKFHPAEAGKTASIQYRTINKK